MFGLVTCRASSFGIEQGARRTECLELQVTRPLTSLERMIADQQALRRQWRERTWLEQLESVKRMREMKRLAREAMRKYKAQKGL